MPINLNQYKNKLLFVPLGGSNEIGMNLNLYHYQGKWLMVDCGIGFNDGYFPGIDILMPNIDFLDEIKENLLGLVITHAHEDHVGAVQYLWPEFPSCPIYATPFTQTILKRKLRDEGMRDHADIHEVIAGQHYALGPFSFEMVPITHSIPEMHAVAIRTDAGTIMHTGDWKLDFDPLLGAHTDEVTLSQYGDQGVLAMVCDSTNVFVEGESGSESDVRATLIDVIKSCEQRAIITTFASNVARLETVVRAAHMAGRQVALAGRSLWRMTQAANDVGYLRDLPPFLTDEEAMKLPRDEVAIICTGCQGEPRAALSRIARGDHPVLRLSPNDTVIFSSRTIPGNEPQIGWMQNRLVEQGLEIITDYNAFIHVSGHPARAELERMYALVRPKIAVPVHGERRHIHEHGKFAHALGVRETVEPENGAVILLEEGQARIVGMVESGYLALDGNSLVDSNSAVLRTRRKLRDQGFIAISLVLRQGELASDVAVSAPGVLDATDDADLFETLQEAVVDTLDRHHRGGGKKPKSRKNTSLSDGIRAHVRKIISQELGKKPAIDVCIHEID
jgi:ribonuclease J